MSGSRTIRTAAIQIVSDTDEYRDYTAEQSGGQFPRAGLQMATSGLHLEETPSSLEEVGETGNKLKGWKVSWGQ